MKFWLKALPQAGQVWGRAPVCVLVLQEVGVPVEGSVADRVFTGPPARVHSLVLQQVGTLAECLVALTAPAGRLPVERQGAGHQALLDASGPAPVPPTVCRLQLPSGGPLVLCLHRSLSGVFPGPQASRCSPLRVAWSVSLQHNPGNVTFSWSHLLGHCAGDSTLPQ